MKKLNRKGFTLIELLAIIVILAIIMVVTIPTVLSSMGSAKSSMFKNSANSVAEWVEKEYSLALVGSADTEFTAICGTNGSTCASNTPVYLTLTEPNGKAFLTTAGVVATNYSAATIQIKSSGRVCVILTANSTGEFSDLNGQTAKSSICD